MDFKLDGEGIQSAIRNIEDFLDKHKIDKRRVLRTELVTEEILLNYQDELGSEAYASLDFKAFGRSLKLKLHVPGKQIDGRGDMESDPLYGGLAEFYGTGITYNYKGKKNNLTINLEKAKKGSALVGVFIAIILGIVTGGICCCAPESVQAAISDDIMTPVFDLLIAIITGVALPMMFLSVLMGIYKIGDVNLFRSIGKGVLGSIMGALLLVAVFCGLAYVPFIDIVGGAASINPKIGQVVGSLLQIMPTNVVEPFFNDNALQLMILAVVFGVVMIILSDAVSHLADVLDQLYEVFMMLMTAVSHLVPVLVYISIFNLIDGFDGSAILEYGKMIIITLGVTVLVWLYYTIVYSKKCKMPLKSFFTAVSTPVLTALTTASSTVALSSNLEVCKEKLKIKPLLVDFALPISQIIFKPGNLIRYVCFSIGSASVCGAEITVGWLLSVVVICFVFSIATPPVAGAATSVYVLIFNQLGLPTDGLGIILTMNCLFDFIHTAGNIYCLDWKMLSFGKKYEDVL